MVDLSYSWTVSLTSIEDVLEHETVYMVKAASYPTRGKSVLCNLVLSIIPNRTQIMENGKITKTSVLCGRQKAGLIDLSVVPFFFMCSVPRHEEIAPHMKLPTEI